MMTNKKWIAIIFTISASIESNNGWSKPLPAHLADNNKIAEASVSIGPFRRDSFERPDDGGVADYTPAAGRCSLNNGAGDGGSQIPMRDGCALLDWQSVQNIASLPIFGAKCDGDGRDAVADTRAAQAAAATGRDVHLPSNNYCIFIGPITMRKIGQRLYGDGSQSSKVLVYKVFAGSASKGFTQGVVTLEAPAEEVRGIGFSFAQPADPLRRSDLTTYQPAIMARQPATVLENILIAGATTCVDMGGNQNAGNSVIKDLQTGCYDYGIRVDGSLDTVSIVRPHHFPFQMNPAQAAIFMRPDNVAIDLGRVDDYAIVGGLCIGTTCVNLRNGVQGGPFGTIEGYDFDAAATGIHMTTPNAALVGSALTFSCGSSGQHAIVQSAGRLAISGSSFFAAAQTTVDWFTGGMQTISGSEWNLGRFDAGAIVADTGFNANAPTVNGSMATASSLTLTGNIIERDPAGKLETPWLLSKGHETVVASGNSETATTHGGAFISLAYDADGHRIIGNSSPGRSNYLANKTMPELLAGSTKGKYFGN